MSFPALFKGYFNCGFVPYYSVAMDLSGKTALVTGAALRIGRAIALALATVGAKVIVHYRSSRSAADAVVAEIASLGARAIAVQADLSVESDTRELLAESVGFTGCLDLLVNSASIFEEALLHSASQEDFLRSIDVNALAPFALIQGLYRHLRECDRSGSVVNLLDTRITDLDRRHVAYALSKRALHTLTQMSAAEFAPVLRVNAVAPGLVLPPAGEDEGYLNRLAHTNPLHRHGSMEHVTDAVLFLLANDFVTGQTIWVDGGRHLKGSFYGS